MVRPSRGSNGHQYFSQLRIETLQKCLGLFVLVLLLLLACSSLTLQPVSSQSRLSIILNRGKLICGVNGELPGFSFVDSKGQYSGFDVDFCRAIAAALFNNSRAVEYRSLSATSRFTALQTGEIDILSSNTTWTINRDMSIGLAFMPITFYDGQGIMVRKSSKIVSLENMKGAVICIITGTTTELNLADQMRSHQISYTPLMFEDVNAAFAAYDAGRCNSITTDRSGLISRRATLSKPEDHILLDVVMSKEPLAMAVADGDSKWFDTVSWIVYSLIQAEELGVNSKNLSEKLSSSSPEIKRLLGLEGNFGKEMGLSNNFVVHVIRQVGNYAEIYDRNLGQDSNLNFPRGLNKLWRSGGLLYSPPFR